jgi:GNAT superfamily N-acetyltransferase
MTLIIRPLELADARAAASLHIETWLDTYRGLLPDSELDALNLNDSLAKWNRILNQSDPKMRLLSVGAFQSGELVGIAGAGMPRDSWGYDSELWAINIPKRFQKMGAGKALLRACVQHALSFGAGNMYLYCLVGNDNAMQFYHHLGAVDTERIKMHEGSQERALVWNDLRVLAQGLG